MARDNLLMGNKMSRFEGFRAFNVRRYAGLTLGDAQPVQASVGTTGYCNVCFIDKEEEA